LPVLARGQSPPHPDFEVRAAARVQPDSPHAAASSCARVFRMVEARARAPALFHGCLCTNTHACDVIAKKVSPEVGACCRGRGARPDLARMSCVMCMGACANAWTSARAGLVALSALLAADPGGLDWLWGECVCGHVLGLLTDRVWVLVGLLAILARRRAAAVRTALQKGPTCRFLSGSCRFRSA